MLNCHVQTVNTLILTDFSIEPRTSSVRGLPCFTSERVTHADTEGQLILRAVARVAEVARGLADHRLHRYAVVGSRSFLVDPQHVDAGALADGVVDAAVDLVPRAVRRAAQVRTRIPERGRDRRGDLIHYAAFVDVQRRGAVIQILETRVGPQRIGERLAELV